MTMCNDSISELKAKKLPEGYRTKLDKIVEMVKTKEGSKDKPDMKANISAIKIKYPGYNFEIALKTLKDFVKEGP